MEIACSHEDFQEAVQAVVGTVDPHHFRQILQNIRLRALANSLELAGTDMEVSVTFTIPAENIELQRKGMRFAQIFIDTKKSGGKAKATELAKKVLSELAEGQDFGAMAREHSHCPRAHLGGQYDFTLPDALDKRLAEVLFALEPGQVAQPVWTEAGCYILRAADNGVAVPAVSLAAIAREFPDDRVSISAGEDEYRFQQIFLSLPRYKNEEGIRSAATEVMEKLAQESPAPEAEDGDTDEGLGDYPQEEGGDAGDERFAALAREYSDGPHAEDGGLWDFTPCSEFKREVADALFGASPGAVMGPVMVDDGAYLVKALDMHSPQVCHIRGEDSYYRVMGEPLEDFPEIGRFPDGKALNVDAIVLREMARKTAFAAAADRDMFAVNGVLLVANERSTKIEMVATDGRRMARIRRKASKASPFAARAVVPVKAMRQVEKMLTDNVESVDIIATDTQLMVRTPRGILISQLQEGEYPDYDAVIPKDCEKKAELDREEFLSAVRRGSVLVTLEQRSIWLAFKKHSLRITSHTMEKGDARVQMSVTYDDDPIDVNFNPDFLEDVLKVLDSDTVTLEMNDPKTACVLKGDPDYVYVVMPLGLDS